MCHKTAGLVANALESSGIATVVVGTMHKPLERVPRAVVTPYISAPVGPAGNHDVQRAIVRRAVRLLGASEPKIETVERVA